MRVSELAASYSYQDNYNKKTARLWENSQLTMRTVLKCFSLFHHLFLMLTNVDVIENIALCVPLES